MHPSALHASSCSSAKETTEKVNERGVQPNSKSSPGRCNSGIVFHPLQYEWTSSERTMHPDALHAPSCTSAEESAERLKGRDVESKSKSSPGTVGSSRWHSFHPHAM